MKAIIIVNKCLDKHVEINGSIHEFIKKTYGHGLRHKILPVNSGIGKSFTRYYFNKHKIIEVYETL